MTEPRSDLAGDWPGKRSETGEEHPAVWHMLDVASCAERLIDGHQAFASLHPDQHRALVVLAALHDVGKISNAFRDLLRKGQYGKYRHWQLSDILLTSTLDPTIEAAFGGDKHTRGDLYAAVSGHHGGPERTNNRHERASRARRIGEPAEKAALVWLTLLLDLLPGGSLRDMDQAKARRISWALSGLTIAADWVASNAEWFPPASAPTAPERYFRRSRRQAQDAVRQAGLSLAPSAPLTRGTALTGLANLYPMQEAVEAVELEEGPVLAVLEDTTGSGKTESALILAHRLIATGRGRGLYFALPTMATANAMFGRMTEAATRLFGAAPSVSLAHGRAALHEGFRALVGAEDDPTPEAGCARWLADDRRRSLLAEVGVGTIDQALMGILPTRFSTLRLFGLTDRILVVDEAHAYDPYVDRELRTLLQMQAMNGGSAIVMTATLPLHKRQAYIDAFQEGLGHTTSVVNDGSYPALTTVSGKTHTRAVSSAPTAVREIQVRRIASKEEAVEQTLAAAARGAACLWVRNAVDEAIVAVAAIRERGCEADLLHARFTLGDRLIHEQAALDRFGREGKDREERVLVATQVVEASLDLDFDFMISDLAPIGAIIQRAGRLWRHLSRRPAKSRPVAGPALAVLSPDPARVEEGADWLRPVLGRGAYVYGHAEQWRTAKVLFDAAVIREPEELRALIEAVHGAGRADDLPAPLMFKSMEEHGKGLASSALAQRNVVAPEQGYLNGIGGRVWDDEKFPTRLGKEDTTLVLARRDIDGLRPWNEANTAARSWILSEVRCNPRWLPNILPDQADPLIAEIKARWPRGKREYLRLCPVAEDGRICDGLRYDSEYGLLFTP